MHFTTIATIASLALGSNAAVLGQRQGALAQFRTFSGTDCFTGNNGFTQVWPETLDTCSTFGGDSVYSVILEQISNGCTTYLYDDPGCTAGRRAIPTDQCMVNEGEAPWLGWMVHCPTDAAGNPARN
ncbi:hypothetical protein BJ170DRAFT_734373 [Xylariales sp. AK1849]|nr:hypothetical protein BJ170DRAFT_734373 [Xylariales sp. AK1849]